VVEETRPVTKTLLAVDDSATMRKVLEITFSGDEFRVVTADGPQAALAKMTEEPSVFLIDTLLGKDDGYALCAEIRRRDPKATILLLASRHNPYDAGRGRDSGADDFVDKPFDTQQMIDKVRKTVLARESGAGAGAPAPQAAAPAGPPPSVQRPPPGPPPSAPGTRPGPAAGGPTRGAPTPERARARTLMFGDAAGGADDAKAPSPQPPAAAPAGTAGHTKPSAAIYPPSRQPAPVTKAAAPAPPPTPKPATAHAASPRPPAVAAASPRQAVASSVNGHLAGKLGELGLSSQQIDAVMALSREVVEQVVWEVVPQLAEMLIKEEIARLTKEG
jgi:CheY-like chemotaxis protein